jgi:hypothetical protein
MSQALFRVGSNPQKLPLADTHQPRKTLPGPGAPNEQPSPAAKINSKFRALRQATSLPLTFESQTHPNHERDCVFPMNETAFCPNSGFHFKGEKSGLAKLFSLEM